MALARDGLKEMIILSVVLGGLTVLAAVYVWPAAIVTGLLWACGVLFFRDPARAVPDGEHVILAPADGKVTAIRRVAAAEGADIRAEGGATSAAGRASRAQGEAADDRGENAEGGGRSIWVISVFLRVYDVHINRAPYRARVMKVQHRPGVYRNAMAPESALVNESNTLTLEPLNGLPGPLTVRQIAGAIARRIVCRAGEGSVLAAGERFGMIKFGSRTELTLPDIPELELEVKVGDKVWAGVSVLARLTGAPNGARVGAEPGPSRE